MAGYQYIFGGDTGETPESVRRKRAVVESLYQSRVPRNVGEGIAAVGAALAARMQDNYLNREEREGRASTYGPMAAIGAALGARGGAATAAGGVPTGAPASTASGADPNVGSTIDFARAGSGGGADAQAIRAGLISRGLPEHVADGFLMNFQDESGLNPGINERNPTVPGSRGGFGLYQLTGPRRVAYEQLEVASGIWTV